VENAPRRCFMFHRPNSWPLEILQQEMEIIENCTTWLTLKAKTNDKVVTRSTAWCVADGCRCKYTYGDVSLPPQPRPEWLDTVEERVLRDGCGLNRDDWPNGVNMNFYENEEQNVGWHSDDEALFRGTEQDCRIISASWGEPRKFEVALKDQQHPGGKPRIFKESLRSIMLQPGDLCSMEGLFQKYYSHQIAKGLPAEQPPPVHKRINLTWRYIVQHKPYCPLSKNYKP